MATTEAPPAPKNTEATKEKKEPVTRDYSVVRRGVGTVDVLIEFLKEYVAEGTETEVTVMVGKANANTPKVAMSKLAQVVDLQGDYETVADQSYKPFKGLSTENKRKVVGL